jgi:tellurite resistance protein TerC
MRSSWRRSSHVPVRAAVEETSIDVDARRLEVCVSVPLWVWALTIAVIIGFLVFDFYAHVRTPHEPTLREAAVWSTFFVAIALLFGVIVLLVWDTQHGAEYFAGFITEKSLSVDNLFVFLLIMNTFAVPRIYQQKVLLIGIVMALVMRGIFIAVGATVIENFSWVFYIFAAFLLYTAWRLLQERHDESETYEENAFIRAVRRVLPTTETYVGDRLVVRVDGRRMITPMAIVMLAIGSTDLLFAFDSIPAIYGLTREPYIVFTANAFALMGLRQLYFLLGDLLNRLVYLSVGLSVILGWIGIKLFIHAMHENELPFINGGPGPFAALGSLAGLPRPGGDTGSGAGVWRPIATPVEMRVIRQTRRSAPTMTRVVPEGGTAPHIRPGKSDILVPGNGARPGRNTDPAPLASPIGMVYFLPGNETHSHLREAGVVPAAATAAPGPRPSPRSLRDHDRALPNDLPQYDPARRDPGRGRRR